MISCRYVGGDESSVGDRDFDTFGQKASFSEQSFKEVVLGGAAFIPEEAFQKLGITDKELEKWGSAGMRPEAPESFANKLLAGQQVYLDILNRMQATPEQVLAEISN